MQEVPSELPTVMLIVVFQCDCVGQFIVIPVY